MTKVQTLNRSFFGSLGMELHPFMAEDECPHCGDGPCDLSCIE